jgi:hypothetical protein
MLCVTGLLWSKLPDRPGPQGGPSVALPWCRKVCAGNIPTNRSTYNRIAMFKNRLQLHRRRCAPEQHNLVSARTVSTNLLGDMPGRENLRKNREPRRTLPRKIRTWHARRPLTLGRKSGHQPRHIALTLHIVVLGQRDKRPRARPFCLRACVRRACYTPSIEPFTICSNQYCHFIVKMVGLLA